MLVHHINHSIAKGPQKKEGADQKKDSRVISPVGCSKKKREIQEKRFSATPITKKEGCFLVCVKILGQTCIFVNITIMKLPSNKKVVCCIYEFRGTASPSNDPLDRKYILKKVQPFPRNQHLT
jgi:hypothetical protein